jgi:hypothetical protein
MKLVILCFLCLCFLLTLEQSEFYYADSETYSKEITPYYNGQDFTEDIWMYLYYRIPGHRIGLIYQENVYELTVQAYNSYLMSFRYWDADGTEHLESTSVNMELNQWHHWTIVYDAAITETKVFKDKSEVYSATTPLQYYPGRKYLLHHHGGTSGYEGWYFMHTHRMWNSKFDTTQITQLYD